MQPVQAANCAGQAGHRTLPLGPLHDCRCLGLSPSPASAAGVVCVRPAVVLQNRRGASRRAPQGCMRCSTLALSLEASPAGHDAGALPALKASSGVKCVCSACRCAACSLGSRWPAHSGDLGLSDPHHHLEPGEQKQSSYHGAQACPPWDGLQPRSEPDGCAGGQFRQHCKVNRQVQTVCTQPLGGRDDLNNRELYTIELQASQSASCGPGRHPQCPSTTCCEQAPGLWMSNLGLGL